MKKTVVSVLCLCLILGSFGGCSKPSEQTKSYFLMDTVVKITIYETDSETAAPILARCGEIITELEALWSRTLAESDVSRINRGERTALDARTVALLEQAMSLSRATNGAFDVTVAPLVELWQTCGAEDRLPTDDELAACLSLVGTDKIKIEEGSVVKTNADVRIDLGGIGKGAAIDALIAYLETCHLQGCLISFGSNVAAIGEKAPGRPFRVAIKDPKNPNGVVGSLTLRSGEILSVSGDYERYVTIGGKQYHHILSPQTGYPTDTGLSSVAVICKSGAEADALSTALMVMGREKALSFREQGEYAFEAVLIAQDGAVTCTEGVRDADFS